MPRWVDRRNGANAREVAFSILMNIPNGQIPTGAAASPLRLREWFDQCVDQPPNQREAWIAKQSLDHAEEAALRRLLAGADSGCALDMAPSERAARIGVAPPNTAAGLVGQTIGAFKLTRLLGQGGMATVFLGEREGKDFRQQVAVKLLSRGLYSEIEQRLFRRERQALAALSHPNIAHLIDGGITDAGIPYIVLEFVDGTSLVEYAADHQLDLRARLLLFVVVCRAVAAAHRLLIVHRDIKPSNILVDGGGQVKLLDFGIAKLLGDTEGGTTRNGIVAMTPAYAAPEQHSGGSISTATDVYSLGVLLQELLLGEQQSVNSSKPRRPSERISEMATDLWSMPMPRATLRNALRGDLDNIVMKALAFEAERRYASAAELADDIERHLGAQPVNAHPPSNWYRTRKFVQRHRGSVATTVTFVLAIIAALAIAIWQAQVARGEAERANAMRGFIVDAFAQAKPSTPRAEPPSIVEVTEQAIATARADQSMSARVRIELLTQLGNVLRGQGRAEASLALSQSNFKEARAQLGDRDSITLYAGHELLQNLIVEGDLAPARELVDTLIASVPSAEAGLRSRMLRDSARIATLEKNQARALNDGSEALRVARAADDEGELSSTLFEFGNMQLSTGDVTGAIATFEETLALRTRNLGARHVNVAAVHTALSRAYRRRGQTDRAVTSARAALDITRAVLPPGHYRLGFQYNALAIALIAQREFVQAGEAAAEALRINRAAYGEAHAETIAALTWVGRTDQLIGDAAKAADELRDAMHRSIARVGVAHADTLAIQASLGEALAGSGAAADGIRELREATDGFAALAKPDPARQALAIEALIRIQLDSGEAADALPHVDQLDRTLATLRSPDAYWIGRATALRARVMQRVGRGDEAIKRYGVAEVELASSSTPDPLLQAEVAIGRAELARESAEASAGERTATALKIFDALRAPPLSLTARAQSLRD